MLPNPTEAIPVAFFTATFTNELDCSMSKHKVDVNNRRSFSHLDTAIKLGVIGRVEKQATNHVNCSFFQVVFGKDRVITSTELLAIILTCNNLKNVRQKGI